MKIGFFGDSFCSTISNTHSIENNYTTYIKKLSDHFKAEIVSLGHGGSSIWDTVLIQFKPFEVDPPDVCIFVWTGPGRLFHRTQRNLNYSSAFKSSDPVSKAAQQYYTILFDEEKTELEHSAALSYFDEFIFSKLKNTKILHLWSFGKPRYSLGNDNGYPYNSIEYHHNWKHGIELRPPLMKFSYNENDNRDIINVLKQDARANHLGTEEINQQLFEMIKSAILSCP